MDQRKTDLLFVMDSMTFQNAMVFLSITVVIPYFLNSLGASTLALSLAPALVHLGTIASQPFFAQRAMGVSVKHHRFVRYLLIQRLGFCLYVLMIPALFRLGPALSIWAFLAAWGGFSLFTGSYNTFFVAIYTKMVPLARRGRVVGLGNAAANAVAVLTSLLAGVLTSKLPFPYNVSVLFLCGVALLLADCGAIAALEEPEDGYQPAAGQVDYLSYLKTAASVLRSDRRFRGVIAGGSCFAVSVISLNYCFVYASRTFSASAAQVGAFSVTAVLATVAGYLLFGVLADRTSHLTVLTAAGALSLGGGLLLVLGGSSSAVYAAFALCTMGNAGYQLSINNYIALICPKEKLPLYVSLHSMLTLALAAAGTLICGAGTGLLGYRPVFTVLACCAALSVAAMLALRRGSAG